MLKSRWKRWSLLAASLAAAAFLLQGCGGGDDGSQGPKGDQGIQGIQGPTGQDLAANTVDATQLTFNDLTTRAVAVAITSADTSGNQPVVKFKVTMKDSGEGLRGLRSFTLMLTQLKPAVNGNASYWQNYIADGLPLTAIPAFTERGATVQTAPVQPSSGDPVTVYNADGTVKAAGYSVVDAGDGNYTVTFSAKIKENAKVPYDATLTHRMGVGVRSVVVPGVVGKTAGAYAGPINPATGASLGAFTNTNGAVDVYDFTPSASGPGTKLAASARDNVTIAACNQCHQRIEHGSNNTSGHFGSRPDTKFCVMCHTPQNTNGKGDFTYFIHQIHMGEELPVAASGLPAGFEADVAEFKYPQDQRQCSTCHKGAVTDSWANPSIKACGSCHNNVDFATGANHGLGGPRTDSSACTLCHDKAYMSLWHTPVNAVVSATSGQTSNVSNDNNLPTGALKLGYVVSSVTVDATTRYPSVKFQITKDGVAQNFGTYNATTNPNIIPNTVSGPSLRIFFNRTQDGITSPADFNAYIGIPGLGISAPSVPTTATPPGTFTAASTTSSVWVNTAGVTGSDGIKWVMTGPDTANTYTVTAQYALPAESTQVTALLYGSFTQTNLTTYPFAAASIADFASYVPTTGSSAGKTVYALKKQGLVLAPALSLKQSTSTGFTARRTVVSKAKCDACHDDLGVKPYFHSSTRNDGTACHLCHNPNGNAAGETFAASTFIHGIHGASKRTTAYTFTEDWSTVGFPGILKNCEGCHIAGSYDFSLTANAAAVTKLLPSTVASGTATARYTAPVASSGTAHNYSTFNLVAAAPATTSLVNSPISSACFSCHDAATARAHMEINGGSIYAVRTAALAKTETCLVCHGAASSTNVSNNTTPNIKAVHRY